MLVPSRAVSALDSFAYLDIIRIHIIRLVLSTLTDESSRGDESHANVPRAHVVLRDPSHISHYGYQVS
jgi:hypothetical protein